MAGAITAVTMPKWGIEMTEGTINDWAVVVGQSVAKGDVLLQVETEKIVNDVEAPAAGTLRRIVAERGEVHPVGSLIAVLADASVADRDVETFIASFKGASVSFEPDAPTVASAPASPDGGAEAGDARMSPIARRLAERLGVDLSKVTGTGRNGRISKEDVESFVAAQSGATGTAGTATSIPQPLDRRPLSPTRATIARRLLEAKQKIPHFRVSVDVAADALLTRKQELAASGGSKVSVNDLIVRAVGLALMRQPSVNVQFVNDEVLSFAQADVAVAVATESGLVAPIVRGADQKSPAEIAVVTADLVERAARGQLKRDEITGGTFTISNLGMYGIVRFDAIINPPQVAILAVGVAGERVIVRNAAPAIGKVMTLTLSADHRVIDGAMAAAFLSTLRELLELPQSL